MAPGTTVAGFFIRACMISISLSQIPELIRLYDDGPELKNVTGMAHRVFWGKV
jgi:hypothetical protein